MCLQTLLYMTQGLIRVWVKRHVICHCHHIYFTHFERVQLWENSEISGSFDIDMGKRKRTGSLALPPICVPKQHKQSHPVKVELFRWLLRWPYRKRNCCIAQLSTFVPIHFESYSSLVHLRLNGFCLQRRSLHRKQVSIFHYECCSGGSSTKWSLADKATKS